MIIHNKRKFLSFILALTVALSLLLVAAPITQVKASELNEYQVHSGDPNRIIKQVNAHVGADAATSANLSWVTVEKTETNVTVKDSNDNTVFKDVVAGQSNETVFTYTVELSKLDPDSDYVYVLENDANLVSGHFKTSVPKNSDKAIRFAFLADPQVRDEATGEATGAIFDQLQQMSEENPLDFVYIAGDHTNTSNDETQWQEFFHNGGLYPDATQKFLLQNTLMSTQGNHDRADFFGHINTPDEIGDGEFLSGVYSVDYGKVKFIVLNNASYNTEDLANNANFQKAVQFLRDEVADAKANDMWTVVGLHKPIYTGASHIADGDVIAYRKALNPIFTELDVDMVLAGHDHVYSRGFVDADGNNATVENEDLTKSTEIPTFSHVANAPFHMVAEHAGGLKWYRAIDYTVSEGDPIAPNYEFLDKNSAQEDPPSGDKKEQTYVIVEMTPDEADFTAYKFKYDAETDAITTKPYVYDHFVVTRAEDLKSQTIKQVNAHVGADAATSRNLSWVTVVNTETSVTVKDAAGKVVYEGVVTGTSNETVYTYTVELTGLNPDSDYTYVLENEANKVEGQFKTSVAKNSDKTIRFAFLADPQVKNAVTGEATGAIFHQLQQMSEKNPLDFVYIAGDHTNTSNDETQWQEFFHNGGLYPNATQDFLLQNTLVSTQGNHDRADFFGHINTPDEIGDGEFLSGVYSVDYGKVKFIVLNNASYNTRDLANNANFQKAVQFLRDEVADAKANGMWTVVGLHKPIYTGASHIADGDVIDYRKALNPIFTELDVDMVLAGHDHVYSRGFVDADGNNASVIDEKLSEDNNVMTYTHVANAPFHMVAEHAGGLKWYRAIDYTVSEGDPIAPNYEFLDKNSAQEDPPSGDMKEQTYVIVEMTPDEAEFTAYKFKYDAETQAITTEPYVYDHFVVTKAELSTEEPIDDGWKEIDGDVYYYIGGVPVKGYKVIEGSAYLFDSNGVRLYGWHVVNNVEMYFDMQSGKRLFGKQLIGKTSYFLTESGKLKGWQKLNDKDYFFDLKSGGLLTGKRTIGNTTYLLSSEGSKLYGWHRLGGKDYFFDPEFGGGMITGKRTVGNTTYLLTEDGKLTGWHVLSGKKYYFDPQFGGGMITGLRKVGSGTYFFRVNESEVGANDRGSAVTNDSVVLKGKQYFFNENGLLIKIK